MLQNTQVLVVKIKGLVVFRLTLFCFETISLDAKPYFSLNEAKIDSSTV